MTNISLYSKIQQAPPIEVLDMKRRYDEDNNEKKINLTVGGYKDEDGNPFVLPVVRDVELEMMLEPDFNHEYLPALGNGNACKAAVELLLGENCEAINQGRAFAIQSLGGTGPIRVGAEFLQQQLGCDSARFSDPTWINHRDIFIKSGFTDVQAYPYWDYVNKKFHFEALMSCMRQCKPKTVFVLHAQAHNPSGIDPSEDQWRQICEVMKRGQLIPFFDCAYQGWASGDLEKDAWAVRYFHSQGLEFLVSQSFGKNLGLYGDRIGFLSLVVAEGSSVDAIKGQLTLILRPMYGNPCRHGARILEKILLHPERRNQWKIQLRHMVERISNVRLTLRKLLEEKCPGNDWTSITDQVGMFWFSGLTREQGDLLATCHVYMMPSNGRITLCGLNPGNIRYFVDTLTHVMVTTGQN